MKNAITLNKENDKFFENICTLKEDRLQPIRESLEFDSLHEADVSDLNKIKKTSFMFIKDKSFLCYYP